MSNDLKNFELDKLSFHTGFHVLFCTFQFGEKWKRMNVYINIFKTRIVNNQEQPFLTRDGFACPCPHPHPGDIWSFLETSLLVTSGGLPLAPVTKEARDAAKHPVVHRTAPNTENDFTHANCAEI